ncbi:MAG: hypothetical protein KDK70_39660 [Myxococcales bacterium]|nr:hypothetical protein [Myxococcales bacterium]
MRRRLIPGARALLLAALCGPWAGGCDFFRELESKPGAGTGTGTDTDTDTGTGTAGTGDTDGACELLRDDRCLDQDTVASCSLADGAVTEVDCVATCGTLTNFSCVVAGTGQHACWCVDPGAQKVLSCTELEGCVSECDLSQSFECADRCFARTDAATVRIYGALVHCAESTCTQTCLDTPEICSACIDAALTQGAGGCSLPRAICDDDRSPEDPSWG